MEETVGNHKPFNDERPNNPSWGIRKCYLFYANLFSKQASEDVRKLQEFVVLNDDGTYSIFNERLALGPGGKTEHLRLKESVKHLTPTRLCNANYISPLSLISVN